MKKHLLLSVILGLATITALPVSAMHRHRNEVLSIDDAAGPSAASSSSVVPYVYQAPQKIDPARAQAEMNRSLKECDELLEASTVRGGDLLEISKRFFQDHSTQIREDIATLQALDAAQKMVVNEFSNERTRALEILRTADVNTFLDPDHSKYLTFFEKLGHYAWTHIHDAQKSDHSVDFLSSVSSWISRDSFGPHSLLGAVIRNQDRMAFRQQDTEAGKYPWRSRFLIEESEMEIVASLTALAARMAEGLQHAVSTRQAEVRATGSTRVIGPVARFSTLLQELKQSLENVKKTTTATYQNAVETVECLIGEILPHELAPLVQKLSALHAKMKVVNAQIAAAQRSSVHGSSALVRSEETEKKTDLLLAVAHLATLDDAAVRADTTEASLVRRDIRLVAKTLGSEGAPLLGIDSRSKITVTVEQMREAFFGALRTLDLEVYGERNRMYFRRATPQRMLIAATSEEEQLAVQAAGEARSSASGSGSSNHPRVQEVD